MARPPVPGRKDAMYKLLLCLRYLRTRYIALASIVSVTLGVATMIVVNAVMAGFATEMKDRIRGMLADVVVETHSLTGEADPDAMMARARAAAPGLIEAVTPTVETYAVMSYPVLGESHQRPVQLIGIDPRGKDRVGPLRENLDSYRPETEDGAVVAAAERPADEPLGWTLAPSGRRYAEQIFLAEQARQRRNRREDLFAGDVLPAGGEANALDPFTAGATPEPEPAPPAAVAAGDAPGTAQARCFIGSQIVSIPWTDPETGEFVEHRFVKPGQTVTIHTVKTAPGQMPKAVSFNATCTDLFRSGMSEYDSRVVFVDIERLQEVRGMLHTSRDPAVAVGREVRVLDFDNVGRTGQVVKVDGPLVTVRVGRWWEPGEEVVVPREDCTPLDRAVTTVQIKLKDDADPAVAVALLKEAFPAERFSVGTWESKQGPLLAAVDMETTILNVLLFLIVAVAGFGILAIFYMIVVEKTRDIGILKALGAGSRGILTIFLSYGLSLGIVGAGVGCVLGLLFVRHINEVEKFISWLTGRKVFDERIYYFPEIPTRVDPLTVVFVACGAVAIAVAASVLPARRAAGLHPVRALRYE